MNEPNPHTLLVKSACRDIAEALPGRHKTAAHLAGVSPGVWSNYCSTDNPEHVDCTIPVHRALRLQERTGRRDLADLFAAEPAALDAVDVHPRKAACDALQTMAGAIASIEAAYADGELTAREQQACLAQLASLAARVATLQAGMAHARIGRVISREDAAA